MTMTSKNMIYKAFNKFCFLKVDLKKPITDLLLVGDGVHLLVQSRQSSLDVVQMGRF
jgi:hypothetical protein